MPDVERAPRVAFVTFGCKVNRAESEVALASLVGGGWTHAATAEGDAVVIDTCTVTAEADHKARKAVHRALRECSGPVVVTGCGASVAGGTFAALGERVTVEPDKAAVPALVAALTGGPDPGAGTRTGAPFRVRAAVKAQDGCDTRCAYCVVPDARGPARSIPFGEVMGEVRALVAADTAEIVLTGVNLGRYADSGRDLADLVEAVAGAGPARVRLSSIEPLDLSDRLLGVLGSTPQVCEHLHVPLQSGSDAVLARMGRGYTIVEYAERLAAAHAAVAGLAVTSDVMAGFPGETAEDFEATLAAAERLGFAKLHVFRYSERPGTRAARMDGAVDPRERESRAAALRALGDRLRAEHIASREGAQAEVLVERVRGALACGTTRDYLRVTLDAPGARVGSTLRAAPRDAVDVR